MSAFSHTLANQGLDEEFLNQPIDTRVLLFLLTSSLKKSIFLYEVIEPFTAKAQLSWYAADRSKFIAGDQ